MSTIRIQTLGEKRIATKEFTCQVYVFPIRNLTIMAKYDAKNAQLIYVIVIITMSQFKDEKTENLPNSELLKNKAFEKTGSSCRVHNSLLSTPIHFLRHLSKFCSHNQFRHPC
jgi:hypothetical protein